MIRFSDWKMISEDNYGLNSYMDYFPLDETIWSRIRTIASRDKKCRRFPVIMKNRNIIGFAYQDDDANRELRMLHELSERNDVLGFKDLYPEYDGVTIFEFNELAWEFAKYLDKQGIAVNVIGELWKEIGYSEKGFSNSNHYMVYAEGTWQRSNNKLKDKLRSVSFCFECIDKIYEENIRIGKIKNADNDFSGMLDRIRGKDVALIGTSDAEDVYDFLLEKGIEACCFCCQEESSGRVIFGKPVLQKEEVIARYKFPIFIECSKNNSIWASVVDEYDYFGFRRNKQFFLIKDYEEVSNRMLHKVLEKRRVVLLGDVDYCNNLYRYLNNYGKSSEVYYVNIWQENQEGCAAIEIKMSDIGKDDICCLMIPSLTVLNCVVVNEQRKQCYIEKLKQNGIVNYTDYFMKQSILIALEEKKEKFSKDLRPMGICIGAILGHSGNILVRDILDGHPNIILMDHTWVNQNLFYLCVKLAGKPGKEVILAFEQIYSSLAKEMEGIIFDRLLFQEKLKTVLEENRIYTSQELFVVFHLADAAMWRKDILNINEIMIYWEPHFIPVANCKEYTQWLEDNITSVQILSVVRDSKGRGGSGLKEFEKLEGLEKRGIENFYSVFDLPMENETQNIGSCNMLEIKFEELKCRPKETTKKICEKLGILWTESLLHTTSHGEVHSYMGVTGFDLKPVYNSYEEYFSEYDRMRIDLITAPWRKKHGYSYVSCLNFTMLELQEMFLKDFRFEEKMIFDSEEERLRLKWRVVLWERRLLRECRREQLIEQWKNGQEKE